MPRTVFHAEMDKLPEEQIVKTHNRWHPDLPFVETFKPGETFRVECYDWTGGQIKNMIVLMTSEMSTFQRYIT